MTYCNNFHPQHQAQLTTRWGGRYGSVNCTPCSAGMAGEADTCGSVLFTGAQIRAASNEPIPDPRSPGMNLTQVDAALYKLSGGRINLDTHFRYDFDALRKRVEAGAQAILQIQRSVLVARGEGHGNGFAGGHAIEIGADSGGVWMDDPLTGRFHTSWPTLRSAAGALVLNDAGDICGYGRAYVSFSRDITATYRVSVHPLEGRRLRTFALYIVDGTHITHRETRSTGGFSAECRAPRLYSWSGHTSQRLVVVTSGFLSTEAAKKGVTYAIPEKYSRADP